MDEILEKLPEEFNIRELMSKSAEKTPYNVIALQECERMNILVREIRRSLKELNLGLKVNKFFYFYFKIIYLSSLIFKRVN